MSNTAAGLNPKETPIQRIESLALRFHKDVTPHPQPDGSCVVRRADTGRYITIPSVDWTILSRLDGKKTVGDILRDRLEQGRGLGLLAFLKSVSALQANGFLIPESGPIPSGRKFGMWVLGLRLPLPKKARGIRGVGLWIAIPLLLYLAAIGFLMAEPLPPLNVSNVGLFAIWMSMAFTLSLRSLLATMVLAQAGTWPWRIGMAWFLWIPFVWCDPRDIQVAGPKGRISLALSELAAPPLAVVGLYEAYRRGFFPPDFFIGALAGAILALWWMLRPFGAGPLIEFAKAKTGQESIGQDARAYLSGQLWKRIFQRGNLFSSEALFMVFALLYPVWGYIGLVFFGEALEKGLIPALVTTLSETGQSSVATWILLGALLAGTVIATGGALVAIFWWSVRVWRERRSAKTSSPRASELDTITKVLVQTPFFATLPQEALQAIAAESLLLDVPARSYAVRQGTMGDQFFIIHRGKMAVLRKYESGRQEPVAELVPGDAFGEMALLSDSARTASVQALIPTQIISISRAAFDQAIAASSLKKEEVTLWLRLSHQLRRSPLFSEMTANEVAYFLKRAERRPVPAGEVLMQEGDVGSHFYVVLSGKLEVTKKGKPVGTLDAGDFMGEIALLTTAPRTATVTAVEHSQVLELSRDAFFDTLASNVGFGSRIIETARKRREGLS